jgi:hypothetical protein
LAILSFAIHQVAPALAKVVFVTGIAGGGLCVVWGIVALAGHKRRAWAILTLIAITIVVLGQVVPAWLNIGGETTESLAGSLLLTFMLLLTMTVLIYLVHGDRPPEFYSTGTARPDNSPSRRNDAHSNGGRHQSK